MGRFSRSWILCGTVLLASACGGADDDAAEETPGATPAPATQLGADTATDMAGVVALTATLTEWDVTLSRDSVPAGPVTIEVSNAGTMPHAFEIEGNGEEFETDAITAGENVTMSVDLAAGEYKVYCPIDSAGTNHEAQGMVTRLRVY